MSEASLKDVSTHFAFGENWANYSKLIDAEAIAQAEAGLSKLIPAENFKEQTFLDIGCGSGLHSLAAAKLGVISITAMDIDINSVETTKQVIRTHNPNVKTDIRQLSIFDPSVSDLGEFDIVYSWGVLHHTGDMWPAVRNAAARVKLGGKFVIALYQRTPLCRAWCVEKRLYTNSPAFIQFLVRCLYISAYALRCVIRGINPFAFIRNYKGSRGMDFFHDVHDWVGGYPYESASVKEVEDFVRPLGFEMIRSFPQPSGVGFFGTGCAEFVFVRR
jgi:SAM-dependent methyltransferase